MYAAYNPRQMATVMRDWGWGEPGGGIAEIRMRLRNVDDQLANLNNQLVLSQEQRDTLAGQLRAEMLAGKDAKGMSWAHQFEAIGRMAQIHQVGWDADNQRVVVVTRNINTPVLEDGSIRKLGRYRIYLQSPAMVANRGYAITFESMDAQELRNGPWPHPHIYEDGHPCLGLIQREAPRLYQRRYFHLLVDLALRFLESVNYDSLLDSPYAWPVAEDSPVKEGAWTPEMAEEHYRGETRRQLDDQYQCPNCLGDRRWTTPEEHTCTCCPFCMDEEFDGIPWTADLDGHPGLGEDYDEGHPDIIRCPRCRSVLDLYDKYQNGRDVCPRGCAYCPGCDEWQDAGHVHNDEEPQAEGLPAGDRPAPLAQQQDQMHERLLNQVRARRRSSSANA